MRRYNGLNSYLKARFGTKVFKVTLDMGADCPNRDGSKGWGGCIYCNPAGSSPETSLLKKGVGEQLMEGINYIKKRHGAKKFIAHFQRYSNTYAPPEKLRKVFNAALNHVDVVGLAVSTRPDCLSDETMELLAELNDRHFLWVELGLQLANDEMLKFLNRGHTLEDFKSAVYLLHKRRICVCAHVILGLPGEETSDIANTAALINELKIEGVKVHNLHVLKETPLEKMYQDGKIALIGLDEYARRTVYFLERLNPTVLIHRLNSHAPRHLTTAPAWSVNKMATLNAVENELKKQDTWQGKRFSNLIL